MIRLEITGNDPAAFYSEAMNTLLLLANGGNTMFRPVTATGVTVEDVARGEAEEGPGNVEVIPGPNPKLDEPPKRGRPRKTVLDEPPIDLTAVHDDPIPDLGGGKPVDEDPLGLGAKKDEPPKTLDNMRDRVKAIVAAHKQRLAASGTAEKEIMPACIAYVRKLFEPFKIKLAAELKEDQFETFWSASQAYLDGTAK